jgi:C-terminal processing protease CtpA/Prc
MGHVDGIYGVASTPNGRSVHNTGIIPDIKLEDSTIDSQQSTVVDERQLSQGLDVLKKLTKH